MAWGSRVLLCCVLFGCAAEDRVDPGALELRDLLGLAPETALAWNPGQRAAARDVIETALHAETSGTLRVALGVDRGIPHALAAADAEREKQRLAALSVVELATEPEAVLATAHPSTLAPRAVLTPLLGPHATVDPPTPTPTPTPTSTSTSPSTPTSTPTSLPTSLPASPPRAGELELVGWSSLPGGDDLPARGLDVLSGIATDAGHRGGPIVVTPEPRLAVLAGYTPAIADEPAHLVVNPVLLAALEPVAPAIGASPARSAPSPLAALATAASPRTSVAARPAAPTSVLARDATGNPYSFYGSVAECAAAQQERCACLPTGTCTGANADCPALAADKGRGYSLVCIDEALAIDTIASCTAGRAPSCPFDSDAGTSLTKNADFFDRPECASALDRCLASTYGTPSSGPPRDTSVSCDVSSCDAMPSCDDEGCDDDDSGDTGDDGCASDSSDDDSGCDGGDGGGDCSGGDGDDCSSDSGGGCSGDSGGGCGGDSGGDCSGGGGDCAGDGGGDCSGGGGDDCNAAGGRHHGRADHGYLWACLPLPFAIIARRRADRRRARREVAP